MKTTVPKLKKLLKEEFKRMLREHEHCEYGDMDDEMGHEEEPEDLDIHFDIDMEEDVDRLRRAKENYGESEFEEDVDRLRRAKEGYGESEFEESINSIQEDPVMPQSDSDPVSQKLGMLQGLLSKLSTQKQGMHLASLLLGATAENPAAAVAFARAMKKLSPDNPISKVLPTTMASKPAAPSQSPMDAEGKKKSLKAKSHAAPSDDTGRYPGPPSAGGGAMVSAGKDSKKLKESPGYDTVSGRDPMTSEPFDRDLKLPIYNMDVDEDGMPQDKEMNEDANFIRNLSNKFSSKKSPGRIDFNPRRLGSRAHAPGRLGVGGPRPLPSDRPTPGDLDDPRTEGTPELPKLSRVTEKEYPSSDKAKKILRDKSVKGHKLSPKQKAFFGFLAGGGHPTKS